MFFHPAMMGRALRLRYLIRIGHCRACWGCCCWRKYIPHSLPLVQQILPLVVDLLNGRLPARIRSRLSILPATCRASLPDNDARNARSTWGLNRVQQLVLRGEPADRIAFQGHVRREQQVDSKSGDDKPAFFSSQLLLPGMTLPEDQGDVRHESASAPCRYGRPSVAG